MSDYNDGLMDGRHEGYVFGQRDMCDWLYGDVSSNDERMSPIGTEAQHDVWCWCLSHNLVIATGLCLSYALGANPPPLGPSTHIAGGIVPAADWRPGHALVRESP